jgi:hypothetical protein
LGQPSLAELLRAVAINGRAEERIGDPTMSHRRGARALTSEQIARPGDEGLQFGALALQRFPGRPRIAELCLAHALHAVKELCESLGILVCELISCPEGRARPTELKNRLSLRRLASFPEGGRLGVPLACEGTQRNAVELLDGAGEWIRHGL